MQKSILANLICKYIWVVLKVVLILSDSRFVTCSFEKIKLFDLNEFNCIRTLVHEGVWAIDKISNEKIKCKLFVY